MSDEERSPFQDVLDTIDKDAREEVRSFLVENRESLSKIPRLALAQVFSKVAAGNSLDAETLLYHSLSREQRAAYRAQTFEAMEASADLHLRSVAILQGVIGAISAVAGRAIDTALDALLDALFEEFGE